MQEKETFFFLPSLQIGQRCTTTRRIIIHEKLYDQFVKELTKKYRSVGAMIKLQLHREEKKIHAIYILILVIEKSRSSAGSVHTLWPIA